MCELNDDTFIFAEDIKNAISFLIQFKEKRFDYEYNERNLMSLVGHTANVFNRWTGYTYVGEQKERYIEKIYQDFFSLLFEIIVLMFDNFEDLDKKEKEFLDCIIYRGKIYRYLNVKDKREIKYNSIYVSWSKKESYEYLESKLGNNFIKLYANIDGDSFGLDLSKFMNFFCDYSGYDRSPVYDNELEVVFPTIKENIYDVKKFKYSKRKGGYVEYE